MSAPDPKTFVVKLTHPTGYFLDIVALWVAAPIQEKWVKTANFTEAANYVSSGPFMMKSWTHQAEIVLVPNPNWYGTKPTITTLHYAIGGDPTANQASFEAGELDMLAANPPDVPRIKADATLGPLVVTQPTLITDYWGFDSSSETTYKGEPHKVQPTANKHFRRALSMAVDKDTMLATVYGGQGTVAGSPIPLGMPGHQDDIGLKYDVTAAKAELDQALKELGYASASEVPTLSFGFNTNAGHEITAAYMQDQWSKNLGHQERAQRRDLRHVRRRAPEARVCARPERLGRGLSAPGQLPAGAVRQQERQQRRGVQQPRVRRPRRQGRRRDRYRQRRSPCTTRRRSFSSTMPPQSSPAGASATTRSSRGSRASLGTGQDSVVIGDLFYENIQLAKH